MTDMNLRKSHIRKSRVHLTPTTPTVLNPDAVCHLRYRLLNATKESGFEVPAVHALAADRFTSGAHSVTAPAGVTELPDIADALSPELAYCCDIEVTNYPLPVACLPHSVFDSSKSVGFEPEKQRFIQSVVCDDAERRKICEITQGQSNNVEWYNQRMGSLTASNFGPILRFMSSGRGKPNALIRRIQNYPQRGMRTVPITNVPSLRWGLKCESVALKHYQRVMKSHHKDVVIQTTGLCVSTDPYLRASPDGIVSCTCHPQQWLLEIKCPWTARNIDPADAVDAGIIRYVRKDRDTYSLIPGAASGYYEQVQGTMAVTCLTHCDVVIWTLRGVLVIPVEFDSLFWEQSKSILKNFFEKYVVTEILTERIWRALPLFDDVDECDEPGTSHCGDDMDCVCEINDEEQGGTSHCADDVDCGNDVDNDESFISHYSNDVLCVNDFNDEQPCTSHYDFDYDDEQLMFFDFSDFEEEETV